jgi:hypothetical protein
MKILHRPGRVTLVAATLILATGCQTPDGRPNNTATGALTGGAFGALAGALIGGASHRAGLGAAIGGLSGALAGSLIGHSMDQRQRAYMYEHSPQTLQKVEYNDSLARQQAALPPPNSAPLVTTSSAPAPVGAPTAPASPAVTTPSQPAPAPVNPQSTSWPQMQQLTAEDVKALAGAGVKDDVVIDEIKKSNSKFSQQDIAALQQAGVSSAVVDFIKTNAS